MSLRPLIACLLLAPMLIGGCDRQSRSAGQANDASAPQLDTSAANTIAAKSPDEVVASDAPAQPQTKLDRSHKGAPMPAVSFLSPANAPVSLAAFKGKPLLLNLWATWCAPCVAEMPTLDKLAARSDSIQVIAVSQDLDGAAKVDPFFQAHEFKALQPYLDPKLALSAAFQANLPTTVLFDSSGHEVWRMTGGYDWTSAKAKALIAEAS